jgi:hypothetical protein
MGAGPTDGLMLQILAWVAERPRTYEQAMEAWRTTCPRLSIWEDAQHDGLVRLEGGDAAGETRVVLTPRGRAALDSAGSGPGYSAGGASLVAQRKPVSSDHVP